MMGAGAWKQLAKRASSGVYPLCILRTRKRGGICALGLQNGETAWVFGSRKPSPRKSGSMKGRTWKSRSPGEISSLLQLVASTA